MPTSTVLEHLQDRLLQKISDVAKAGGSVQIPPLGRLLEQTNRDLESARLIENRIRETESLLTAPSVDTVFGAAGENKKAKGNRIRRDFAARLGLQQVRGVEYKDKRGQHVGIATATEHPSGHRWWLGLPNVDFDVVVLLCERSNNQLEFIIPRAQLGDAWKRLSRDAEGREVKLNVRTNQGEYELLVTGSGPVGITPFLGQSRYLNSDV